MAKKLSDYGLKVTDIRCYKVPNEKDEGLVAIMEVEFNDVLVVGSVKLYRSVDGNFYFQFPSNPQSKRKRAFSFLKDENTRDELLEEFIKEI